MPNSFGLPDDENEYKNIPKSPFKLFSKWVGEARTSVKHKRDEMWLYGGPQGKRYVCVHGWDYRGFTWFDKKNEIKDIDKCTAEFSLTWGCTCCIFKQVEIDGSIEQVGEEET